MTKTEMNKFTQALEAKQAELIQALRNRDGILIEKSPDALDEVQNATERELAIRNLHGEFNLLRKVRAALSRVDERIYGICQHCEDEISPKRLNAVPWVPYCIRCQETTDRNQEAGNEIFYGLPTVRPIEPTAQRRYTDSGRIRAASIMTGNSPRIEM